MRTLTCGSCLGTAASEYAWPFVVPTVWVVAPPSVRPEVCVTDSPVVRVRRRLTLCRCANRPATKRRSRPMCSAARIASGLVASRMNAVCLVSRCLADSSVSREKARTRGTSYRSHTAVSRPRCLADCSSAPARITAGLPMPLPGPPSVPRPASPPAETARVTHWMTRAAVRSAATSRGPSARDRQVSRAGGREPASVPSAVSGSTTAASLTRFPATWCRKPPPNSAPRLARSPSVSWLPGALSPVTGSPVTGSPVTGSPVTGSPAGGAPGGAVTSSSSAASAACSRPMVTSAPSTPVIFLRIIRSVARPAAVAPASSACTTSTISDAICSPASPASSGVRARSLGSW